MVAVPLHQHSGSITTRRSGADRGADVASDYDRASGPLIDIPATLADIRSLCPPVGLQSIGPSSLNKRTSWHYFAILIRRLPNSSRSILGKLLGGSAPGFSFAGRSRAAEPRPTEKLQSPCIDARSASRDLMADIIRPM